MPKIAAAAALSDAELRMSKNNARVEVLKEMVVFHRSLKPTHPENYEAALIALTTTYLKMGDWLNEALREALIEAKQALGEVRQIHENVLRLEP